MLEEVGKDHFVYQLQGMLHYFQALQLQLVHACHCTDLAIALSRVVKIEKVGVGITCL
ncbi:MAG TPA: hypothetical protein VN631_11220 [Negativicutes bacterium]|nr:hypothetical protein [Negativicutes bacterium]